MSREIEEMAKVMCQDAGTKNCNISCNAKPICDVHFYAERLYKEGYRKQSEDMVEVVRCKDCAHYVEMHSYEYNGRKARCCIWHHKYMNEYEYCSDGIRKGDRNEQREAD